MADVRPGERERRPARLRRADVARASSARRSRSPRGSGTAAFCPAGSRASSSAPRATRCCTSAIPPASTPSGSATWSTPSERSTGCANEAVDDPEIATRISQYEMAFRMQTSVPGLDGPFRANRKHVLDMYGTSGADGSFARQLPAGPPAGRAGRAVHSALPPRLGPSRQRQGDTSRAPPAEVDQGVGRADHGPQAARHARRHAGHLGRRVRPHADGPGRTAATTTSRASRCGWPAAASRAA